MSGEIFLRVDQVIDLKVKLGQNLGKERLTLIVLIIRSDRLHQLRRQAQAQHFQVIFVGWLAQIMRKHIVPALDYGFLCAKGLFFGEDRLKIGDDPRPFFESRIKQLVLQDFHGMEHGAIMRYNGEHLLAVASDKSIPQIVHIAVKKQTGSKGGLCLDG